MPVAGVLFSLGKFRDRPPCEPSRQSSARCTKPAFATGRAIRHPLSWLFIERLASRIRTGVRPLLPRGEHRHCQILSPPLVGGFLYSPVRLPCCSWLLGTEEPCPALSNWCFALIPLAGLRPELARWLQRAAVNPVPHLWVLERINLLAVQAFKGGNLLVLSRQNARLSALGTRRSRLIGHRRF